MTPSCSIKELLLRLSEADESYEIEAKRSEIEVGKSTLETISAFANEPGLGGGYILFGVTEDSSRRFTPRGVADPKKLEQEISSICASSFNRTIRPRVWTEIIDGVPLVAAFIPETTPFEKPVFISSKSMQHGTYRRIGSTDQRCTEDDLRVLFQASSITPYEDTVVDGATMEDLDSEVITIYRRSLIEANPATELRDVGHNELVQSLGGAKRVNGSLVPTVAGVLLFAKRVSLRRLFPGARADYIRVPGTKWVPDSGDRFESIEVREPLLVAFRRIYNAVVDDLPKSFSLEPGSPERQDRMALPESTVREVLVNALTHRDYRIANPTQIIRYQDRIEVRNAGYSLASDDQLGEPGSFPRNMRVADVFREMRLAENKGTGIAAVRRAMERAGLTPPVFDSDRARNIFVATLWLHNLISDEEGVWLEAFASERLSDAQARALVVARRTGSVTNSILRDVSGLDTLSASIQLRQLCEVGLLDRKGKSVATHYVLSDRALPKEEKRGGLDVEKQGFPLEKQGFPLEKQGFPLEKQGFPLEKQGFPLEKQGFPQEQGGVSLEDEAQQLLHDIPPQLRADIHALGGRPTIRALRRVLVSLCELRWWTPRELATVLHRKNASQLAAKHLSPLVKDGTLRRRFPENLAHPQQAYRASKTPFPDQNAVEDV
ncbi:MAG: putative DNA binding domain-containing protein [Polyangiaceae bacterium]|nr:putative DNA binding domain-containing protein [Polyangiaceae bacterium]